MSKLVKFIIAGLAVFGGISLVLIFAFNFVIDCTDLILREVPSPDGTYNAKVFRKVCQSTKTQVLHFEIGKADSGIRETIILGPVVTTDLGLSWISATKLEIIYPHNVSPPRDSRAPIPFLEDVWVSFRQKTEK